MNLAFEKVRCAVVAAVRPAKPSWKDAYLAELSKRALRAADRGRLPDAEACCLYVVKANPAQEEALACLGLVAAQRGDWEHAAGFLTRAAASGSASAGVHRELGAARRELGDFAGAQDSLRTALRLAPGDPDTLAHLARLCLLRGELANATTYATSALERNPAHSAALRTLGLVHARRGDYRGALQFLGHAAHLSARDASVWTELGTVHRQLSQLDEARQCFERALMLNPDSAELHVTLGELHLAARRTSDAKSYFEEALRIAPLMTRARSRLAAAAAQAGDTAEAERLLLNVRDLDPGDLDSLVQLGELHHQAGRIEEALDCYRRAKALDPIAPDVHVHAALAHLHRGDFEAGWAELEWRLRMPAFRGLQEIEKPVWQDEDVFGRALLVQFEPGISDNIQFLRYAPLLARRGARVIVETHPELHRLVTRMPDIEVVVTGSEELARAATSVHWRCPLLSLPHRFRTTPETVPSEVPYLFADAARSAAWRVRLEGLPGARRIGWTWLDGVRASPGEAASRALAEMQRLVPPHRASFVSLERGAGEDRPTDADLVDWTSELADFADVADLVAALDLVIGPANAVTHLAAALGKPVWILIPHSADWRWVGRNGESTSAWYPTARLFRAHAPGGLTQMMRDVTAALAESDR